MRHNNKFNHLGRKAAHRKSMLANMACDLIKHKRINTTLAKAKALRIYIEPLLTRAKTDNTNNRRVVFSILKQKKVITELFSNVGDKIANRPGGYCRILKTGFRLGDAAQMAMIELVDYNENMLTKPTAPAKKSTRRGRAKKNVAQTTINDNQPVETSTAKTDETPSEIIEQEPAPIQENITEDPK